MGTEPPELDRERDEDPVAAILRSAARRIRERGGDSLEIPGEIVSQHLEEVIRDLSAFREGVRSAAEELAVSEREQRSRVVEELREELARRWEVTDTMPEAADLLSVMPALEELRRALLPDRLGELPTESDPFELLVELVHDLRAPLTSILFMAEVLGNEQSGPLTELQRSQLRLIYGAAFGLSTMVADVMDLAKSRSDYFSDGPVVFSIADVLESIDEMVRPLAEAKEIELIMRPTERDQYLGYPTPLQRVLLNLAVNGVKFTDAGKVEISATHRSDDAVEFSVTDTGRGIGQDAQWTLYQPFKKAQHREGHFFSRSGLGLSIARRLVKAMGGVLRFKTGPGEGTRFYFTLTLPSRDFP